MDSIGQITTSSGAIHSRHFVKIVAATAALAGLLFGFDTGVISGAILFIKGEFRLMPFAEELLVSAALVGAVCGSILSGRFTDLIERKRVADRLKAGDTIGTVPEGRYTHKIMVRFDIAGDLELTWIQAGNFTIDSPIARVRDHRGDERALTIQQTWPVRRALPQKLLEQEDHLVHQKSPFLDMVYLQQDAFDEVDASAALPRQKRTFDLVFDLVNRPYQFADKSAIRDYFVRLTGLFKNLNYSKEETPQYKELLNKVQELADSTANPKRVNHERSVRLF
jgi:vacuolar-type H+-ATPase catalytic subunit A/Vma1